MEGVDRTEPPVRALVLHPDLKKCRYSRSGEARLAEAVGLSEAINLVLIRSETVSVPSPKPSTLFGQGVIEYFHDFIRAESIGLVVVDTSLSPVQQRNLERAWNAKVIDRTGLILEIFGRRARTKEGKLQVDLAQLNYQRSRLVRSWTHLERQRGGAGFMGGPGERQIELDRRMIDDKIARLKADLEQVKRTRELHRSARRRVPYPIIALVGYTNAGKSTLFNRLTSSNVFAQDLLFATLDPTMRRVSLPSGREVILSDTVGFISELPVDLIAAFRATLEEVLEADILVHVRDLSHEDSRAQKDDVRAVLSGLNLDDSIQESMVEVWNKLDLLSQEERAFAFDKAGALPMVEICSATTGEGCDILLNRLDQILEAGNLTVDYVVPYEKGAALAWLFDKGTVVSQEHAGDGVHLTISLSNAHIARCERSFSLLPKDRF